MLRVLPVGCPGRSPPGRPGVYLAPDSSAASNRPGSVAASLAATAGRGGVSPDEPRPPVSRRGPAACGPGARRAPGTARRPPRRSRLLTDSHRQGREPDRAAAEAPDERVEHGGVEPVQPDLVDLVDLESRAGDLEGDHAVGLDLGVVADPAEQPVGDARGPPRPAGHLRGAGVVHRHIEQLRRPPQHGLELLGGVEVHVRREAEAVAQRSGQQPRAGGGADERERRDLERDRGGTGALADDDVDPEVLHRHVEHLFSGPGHPMDLVEEEHLALGQARQDRGQVTGVLDRGTAGDAQRLLHLGRDDHRQRGLAEARWAAEQHVVGSPLTRRRAASSMRPSWARTRCWPMNSSSVRGRSAASTARSSMSAVGLTSRSSPLVDAHLRGPARSCRAGADWSCSCAAQRAQCGAQEQGDVGLAACRQSLVGLG